MCVCVWFVCVVWVCVCSCASLCSLAKCSVVDTADILCVLFEWPHNKSIFWLDYCGTSLYTRGFKQCIRFWTSVKLDCGYILYINNIFIRSFYAAFLMSCFFFMSSFYFNRLGITVNSKKRPQHMKWKWVYWCRFTVCTKASRGSGQHSRSATFYLLTLEKKNIQNS